MVLVLAQDVNTGDLVVGPRGLTFLRGAQAVAVLISNALRQQPGEDKLDPARGIPWSRLLGKRPSPAAVRGLVMQKVQRIRGVANINRCDVFLEGETMRCELEVLTTEGEVANVDVEV